MFRALLSLFSADLAVDVGTANTLVYTKEEGVVLREPSVVALNTMSRRVEAVGQEAYDMIGKTPAYITAIRPMKNGVIADFEAAERMINYFAVKALKRRWAAPRMVVGVPLSVTPVEKRAVRDSILRARASEVFLIDQPMAAAIGAGMDVKSPQGCCIVDVGGGTTDIAVIALAGIAAGASVTTAGDEFTDAIREHLHRHFSLLVGERTAERVKMQIGTAKPTDEASGKTMVIRGRHLTRGTPTSITLSDRDVYTGLEAPVQKLVQEVHHVLERTPPELAADLIPNGIVLTGGGSLLRSLGSVLGESTGLEVRLAENPLDCVVLGAGRVLDEIPLLRRVALAD